MWFASEFATAKQIFINCKTYIELWMSFAQVQAHFLVFRQKEEARIKKYIQVDIQQSSVLILHHI